MNSGNVIKKLRQDKKLTQDELSRILGVNKSSIQKYESGAVNNLKMDTIRALCELFKVPPWVFIYPEHLGTLDNLSKFQYKNYANENIGVTLSLNEEGLKKLIEYARDLVDCGNYKN